MSNPYAGPDDQSPVSFPSPSYSLHDKGLVGHVRALGIVMAVIGVLEGLVGIGLLLMAFVMPQFMVELMKSQPPPPGGNAPNPQMIGDIMMYVYGGLGVVVSLMALLRVFAGISVFRFRSRTLGIVALIAGLLTSFTVYCLPTSLGICIYGLIVLFNGPVMVAFRMGAEGYNGDQIVAAFDSATGPKA